MFKRINILLMLISFVVLAVTGIIKFPETQKYFLFIYGYWSSSKLSMIHDWSGVALVGLILVHLLLKREGLKKVFLGEQPVSSKMIYFILGIIITISMTLFIRGKLVNEKKTISLSAVEVREYQGEKLGSIEDFRENSIKGPQYIDRNSYRLEVSGLVVKSQSYSYDDILKLPTYQKVVTINCVEGWSVKGLWKGVLVKDLLKNLVIKPEAKTIIFYAEDGYSTSFPLDYVMQNEIIMADKLNGVELPPERGFPFQLVAEQKWGYKWIKWITKIELSSDINYKGFWESRGYNNDGNQSGSKFSP